MAEQEKDVNTGANTEERETDTSSGEPSGNEESSVAESVAEETSNTTQATDAPPHTKPPPTAEAEEPSTVSDYPDKLPEDITLIETRRNQKVHPR